MNKKIDVQVSVIVLTYNTSVESIMSTLASIIKQKNCKFEIIISDDGSSKFPRIEIEQFFSDNKFENYLILERDKNVGTVRNLEYALKKAQAKYVKDIGQGDILYDQYALCDCYNYAEEKLADVVIGDAVPFCKRNDTLKILNSPVVPYNIKCYQKGKEAIKKHYLLYCDFASGTAFFFNREVMIDYINKLKAKVKLAEDLALRLMVYDEKNIVFMKKNVTFYEIGVGVSWKGKGLSQMKKDELGVSELLIDMMNGRDPHLRKVIMKRNEMLVNSNSLNKIKYLFSDLTLLLFKIKKKIFPRKIKNVDNSFLHECVDVN